MRRSEGSDPLLSRYCANAYFSTTVKISTTVKSGATDKFRAILKFCEVAFQACYGQKFNIAQSTVIISWIPNLRGKLGYWPNSLADI